MMHFSPCFLSLMVSARASVKPTPYIFCKRQTQQPRHFSTSYPKMQPSLAVSEVVVLAVAVALSYSCRLGFCIPIFPQKTGATVLLSPPLLVLDAGKPQIFKLFFILYRMCSLIVLFGVVSCLFAYLCIYLVFQIMSRTSLGCSLFCPVRPISSFSEAR
jgi:hypothetical protein